MYLHIKSISKDMGCCMNNIAKINRIIWIIFFLAGSVYFVFLEWGDEQNQALGWFLLMGLWSAICAIGFTIFDWLLHFRS